ncbi:MAG: Na/Pi cotransporter family protein, partial [Sulfurimonas sp.]|nr:Na/Pi cotransporter family protein [Sulfurimonas sp.]
GVLAVAPFTSKLVVYLKSLFKEEEKDISRARYLDSAVIEVPQAAIAALRKEVIHLYDNSTEVLSHALSLHRHTFIGMGDEIRTVVQSSVTQIDMNIDDFYEKKIKILYGDIINYATISQENMSVEDKQKIYSLQIACRDIVEIIKDVKEIQKNVNRFIKSKNEFIRGEYNYLREVIAETLDGIYALRNTDDDLGVLAKLKIIEKNFQKLDLITNGRIDNLIRSNSIDIKMATSIINDSNFAHSIFKKLIGIATILWIEDKHIQELGEK